MLREWKATEKPEEGELKKRLIAARDKLARQQMLIKEKKVPVLVLCLLYTSIWPMACSCSFQR